MTELGVWISKASFAFRYRAHRGGIQAWPRSISLHCATAGPVVVKAQRPNIRHQLAEDFEVLAEIAGFPDDHTEIGRRYRFGTVLAEFRATIREELNYEREKRRT